MSRRGETMAEEMKKEAEETVEETTKEETEEVKEETAEEDSGEGYQCPWCNPDSDHPGRYQGDRLQVLHKSSYDRIYFRYDCPGNKEAAPRRRRSYR